MELNRMKIEDELKRLGWTQSELADRMGVHRQQLNKLLRTINGGTTLRTVDRVADALGVFPKDLII